MDSITYIHAGTAENRRQFTEAMQGGHIRAWLYKLLMYGAAGSGKTSTKEMIVGNPPPEYRESTPLAMRPTTVYRVSLEGEEFTKLTTLEERKMFLARTMVNIDPDLVVDLLKTRYTETSASGNESADVAEPQVKPKEQPFTAQSVPPPLATSASAQPTRSDSLASLSSESDEVSDIDSKVDSILQSISTDEELVKMMDQLSTTIHPLAAFRILQIIDSGGQPQFHEILPIFLRRLHFYVFVFRLCDNLSSRPVVEYYVDGKPVGPSFTSSQTIEQLLQHCARTMHSHRSSSGSEGECPQIMIVGTHVDQEKKSSETREQKNTTILKLLLPTLGKQIVYRNVRTKDVVFPLNAKTPGSEEKVIIEQVREVLFGKSLIQPVDIPLKWFALEILLEEMAQALKQGVLSRQDCFNAAVKKLHFEDDAAEFDAAIQYLDDLSVLFYYPHILPEVIFADPQVILDKVTELVLASFQRCGVTAKGEEWRKFYEFALVTLEFLSQEEFSKHYVPGVFEVDDLIDLFTKLLIFAHFSATQLFVPALLRDLGKEEVDKHRLSIPSLAVQFPDGGPRKGIFCALLCWLVSPDNTSSYKWSISVDEIGAPICLYRNCVQFDLCDSPATVTLIDTYTHFEVHVDIEEEWIDDLYPKIIPAVRESIFKGLHKATLNLRYYNSSPKPALVCPCGEGEAHIAMGNVVLGFWTCALSRPKRKCGKLTSHQLLWLNNALNDKGSKQLTESDMPNLLSKLDNHASKWRDVGMHLGFQQNELDNIQDRPVLFTHAPQSWQRAMLSEWLEWAPRDSRRSSSFATLEALKDALNKSGLGATASTL